MATSDSNISKLSTYSALKASTRDRYKSNGRPIGTYLLTGSKAVVAADYDVLGDIIELFEFPDNTYLIGGSVVSDKDFDTGGTAGTFDLIAYDSTGTASTVTGATAVVMGNQPANDGIEIVSASAADVAPITVTIIGTTHGTDTVVVEEIALDASDGTTPVSTVKTDWGLVLAVKKSGTTAGTITIREASGNATITAALTATVNSAAVSTVTDTDFGDKLAVLYAAGASTKQVGLKGTDINGNVIYDSQALAGTAPQNSNRVFSTITEIYYGDVANGTVVTVAPAEQVLVAGATVFNSTDPTPLNYAAAAIVGSEFAAEVSERTLALRIAAAPTTANTGTVTFTYKFLVFVGDTTELV